MSAGKHKSFYIVQFNQSPQECEHITKETLKEFIHIKHEALCEPSSFYDAKLSKIQFIPSKPLDSFRVRFRFCFNSSMMHGIVRAEEKIARTSYSLRSIVSSMQYNSLSSPGIFPSRVSTVTSSVPSTS